MAKNASNLPGNLKRYFESHVGERVFLNADRRQPNILQRVEDDYLSLAAVREKSQPEHSFIVPLNSVVSVQEVEGLGGMVIYLMK